METSVLIEDLRGILEKHGVASKTEASSHQLAVYLNDSLEAATKMSPKVHKLPGGPIVGSRG